MKLKIFSVYDSKTKAWLKPFFMQHTGQAQRSWEQVAIDPQSEISKYPADFTLFELGEFDELEGNITQYDVRVSLGTALQAQPAQPAQVQMFPGARTQVNKAPVAEAAGQGGN